MQKTSRSAALIFVIVAGAAGYAFAHSGAQGIVKQRMDAMSDIGKAMKTIAQMIRGQSTFDSATAQKAAKDIGHNAAQIPELFPEGSIEGPSEATPAIWENWEEFAAMAARMETAANDLAAAAQTAPDGVAIAAQFGKVGKTCNSCHGKFRVKK
jgi:cytochrome c556